MKQTNDWIVTYSGHKLCLLNPDPESILIEDIAHGLALACRWGGQCKAFYSVAQHSIMVSSILPRSDALWGLLHDAAEAYITDIPRPLKRMLPDYRVIESKILLAVSKRFGLPATIPGAVKKIDNIILATEAKKLLNYCPPDMYLPEEPLDIDIMPIDYRDAERLFLEQFNSLME